MSATNATVLLSDPPAVVRLKREFRGLCEREEALKGSASLEDQAELEHLQGRKSEIGWAIFEHLGRRN